MRDERGEGVMTGSSAGVVKEAGLRDEAVRESKSVSGP